MKPPNTLDRLLRDFFGVAPDEWEPFTTGPAGKVRGTARVRLGDRVLYATRRTHQGVANKEAGVLRALSEGGAPVPRFLAFEDGWLLQESAGDERLAQTLDKVQPERVNDLLDAALKTLAEVQEIGKAAGLEELVSAFGSSRETGEGLLASLRRVGDELGMPAPALTNGREEELLEIFVQPRRAFIKWDARPGNAALGADGRLRWFDWQHANLRHPVDDRVWLLCDEAVPESGRPVERLVSGAEGWGASLDYICVLGVLHCASRMGAVLCDPSLLEVSWEDCLHNDWCGSRESVRRLSRRAGDLASHSELTAVFAPWFDELARHFAR